jgi:hypothetical protein
MAATIELLDPRARVPLKNVTPALRRPNLKDARIGILDNGKHQGGLLLELLENRLAAACGTRPGARARKRIMAEAASPGMLAELAGCDVVLTAIGD